ncbi:SEC-C metal-binding domain-containing protein [Oceanobacillus sp. CAU 1775]
MPHVPAICDSCGTVFNSGIFIENSTNVSLSGNKSGPCPNCGGWGHVPDGVFNFIGNAIEILSAPERTIQDLKKLSVILQAAKNNNSSYQEIEKSLEKETPALSELLPKNREEVRKDLKFWITSILIILQILLPLIQENKQTPDKNIEVNQVINQFYIDTEINNPTNINKNNRSIDPPNVYQPIWIEKIGRNELCPCGSGKKYKYCHLNQE